MTRGRRWATHLGGTLGPFGSYLVIPVLPEIAERYDVSLVAAAWSVSAYTFALAAAMFLTGAAARRWGLARTIRFGYVGFALATALCVLAPTMPWFLAGRALQGTANAFTTPLLVVVLQRAVTPDRLGRELGLFGSAQAAGMAAAPALGGALALVDYRFALAVTLAACLLLAVTAERPGPREVAPRATPRGPRKGFAPNLLLARACGIALVFNLAGSGILVLSAALGEHQLGMDSSARGAIIGCYGVAGLLAAPLLGGMIGRYGVRAAGALSFLALAAAVTFSGWATSELALVVGVTVAGAASTASRVTVNSLALASTPHDPAGAASATMATMFLGAALAPQVLLPMYGVEPHGAFVASGAGAALAAVLLLPRLARETRRGAPTGLSRRGRPWHAARGRGSRGCAARPPGGPPRRQPRRSRRGAPRARGPSGRRRGRDKRRNTP